MYQEELNSNNKNQISSLRRPTSYVWVTAFHNSPCEPCHLLRAPSMPWRYGEPVEGWWACTKAPTFSSWMAEQRPTIAIALCVAVKEGSHLYLWSVSWGSFSGFRGLGVGLVSRIFEHVMIWIFRSFTWIGTMKSIFHRFYGPIHFWSSTPSNIACFGNIWSIFKTNLSKGVIFIGSQNMCPKSLSFCFVQESEFCPYFHHVVKPSLKLSHSV